MDIQQLTTINQNYYKLIKANNKILGSLRRQETIAKRKKLWAEANQLYLANAKPRPATILYRNHYFDTDKNFLTINDRVVNLININLSNYKDDIIAILAAEGLIFNNNTLSIQYTLASTRQQKILDRCCNIKTGTDRFNKMVRVEPRTVFNGAFDFIDTPLIELVEDIQPTYEYTYRWGTNRLLKTLNADKFKCWSLKNFSQFFSVY
jgi:hypothetical protein